MNDGDSASTVSKSGVRVSAEKNGQLGLSTQRWEKTEIDNKSEKTLGGTIGGRDTGSGLRERLLDVSAHRSADLARVRSALQLTVCVDIAAQLRLLVSKGALCLRQSDAVRSHDWLKEEWQMILRAEKRRKGLILFEDEERFAQWGALSYTWARVDSNERSKRVANAKATRSLAL